jgi:serine-type D-Ala-D-Ala carboxypeptidase/endopeptidase (penicillin-binding protein 4)
MENAELSFVAIDLETGAIVAAHDADKAINPASNAKVITSATALNVLKPEFRFKTEYYLRGELREGTLKGDLIVKGYGDPSIVTERLTSVANELYLSGIERITGSVIVDDSYFDEQQEARGWEQEEAPDRAYAAPVSAVMVNFNTVALHVRAGDAVGAPAVVRVDPPSERVYVEGEILTDTVTRGIRIVGESHKDDGGRKNGTMMTVEGAIALREPPFRMHRRVYDPARHFGSVLVGLLQRRGVKMRHSVNVGPVPPGARLHYIDRSAALKEIVDDLNHYSNNIMAEALIKTMGAQEFGAPGTFEHGLQVCRKYLEDNVGLQPGSYVFANGSGLNDVNRFSAKQMAQIVRVTTLDYEIGTEFTTSLAVAGTQGTIASRMKDTPVVRRLRAKTGTLSGVSALSGTVVQPSGKVIAFSIMAQGLRQGSGPAHRAQTMVGNAFATDGAWRPEVETEEAGEAISAVTASSIDVALGG